MTDSQQYSKYGKSKHHYLAMFRFLLVMELGCQARGFEVRGFSNCTTVVTGTVAWELKRNDCLVMMQYRADISQLCLICRTLHFCVFHCGWKNLKAQLAKSTLWIKKEEVAFFIGQKHIRQGLPQCRRSRALMAAESHINMPVINPVQLLSKHTGLSRWLW